MQGVSAGQLPLPSGEALSIPLGTALIFAPHPDVSSESSAELPASMGPVLCRSPLLHVSYDHSPCRAQLAAWLGQAGEGTPATQLAEPVLAAALPAAIEAANESSNTAHAASRVPATLHLAASLLAAWCGPPQDEARITKDCAEAAAAASVVWGIGGALPAGARAAFEASLRTALGKGSGGAGARVLAALPAANSSSSIFEGVFDATTAIWRSASVDASASTAGAAFVPTTASAALLPVLQAAVQQGLPVALVGSAGAGKSTLARRAQTLLALKASWETGEADGASAPTASELCASVAAAVGTSSPGTAAPEEGKQACIHIDNLPAPSATSRGSCCAPWAAVQQICDHSGWLDEATGEWQELQRTSLLTTATADGLCALPAGVLHLHVPPLSVAELGAVFGARLARVLQGGSQGVLAALAAPMAAMAADVLAQHAFATAPAALTRLCSSAHALAPNALADKAATVRWAACVLWHELSPLEDQVGEAVQASISKAAERHLSMTLKQALAAGPKPAASPGALLFAPSTNGVVPVAPAELRARCKPAFASASVPLCGFSAAVAARLACHLRSPGCRVILRGPAANSTRELARAAAQLAGIPAAELTPCTTQNVLKDALVAAGTKGQAHAVLLPLASGAPAQELAQAAMAVARSGISPRLFSAEEQQQAGCPSASP